MGQATATDLPKLVLSTEKSWRDSFVSRQEVH
jgi:hypothetical protein